MIKKTLGLDPSTVDGRSFKYFRENGKIIKLKVLVSTSGLMGEPMRVNGSKIKCMDKENTAGQTGENTKATTLMTSSKAKEYSYGQMVEYTKEIGSKENSMAEAP